MFAQLLLLAAVLLVLLSGLRIINEHERGLVFRLGRFHRMLGPGLVWITPATERMARVDVPAFFPEWRSFSAEELEERLRERVLNGEIRV